MSWMEMKTVSDNHMKEQYSYRDNLIRQLWEAQCEDCPAPAKRLMAEAAQELERLEGATSAGPSGSAHDRRTGSPPPLSSNQDLIGIVKEWESLTRLTYHGDPPQKYVNAGARIRAILAVETTARPDMYTPWPLHDVLAKLIKATEHLLNDHGCDTHGYEEYQAAANSGKTILQSLNRPAEKAGGDV